MAETSTISEADILSEIIAPERPGFSRQWAESIVQLRFSDDATHRIQEFLGKNNAGNISPTEREELDKYLRVGQFLDLMQAKARLMLQQDAVD